MGGTWVASPLEPMELLCGNPLMRSNVAETWGNMPWERSGRR